MSVPCRYIHSPVARLSLDDFENTVRLMRESLKRLTPDVLKSIADVKRQRRGRAVRNCRLPTTDLR